MQIVETIDDLLQWLGKIREQFYQVADHTFFVIRPHEYGTYVTQRLDHPLRERPHRWLARKIEEFLVSHRIRRAVAVAVVNMAGPLHGHRRIGPRTLPERHGRSNRLEVQVVTWVRQSVERLPGAVENFRHPCTGHAMYALLRCRAKVVDLHIANISKPERHQSTELRLAAAETRDRVFGVHWPAMIDELAFIGFGAVRADIDVRHRPGDCVTRLGHKIDDSWLECPDFF